MTSNTGTPATISINVPQPTLTVPINTTTDPSGEPSPSTFSASSVSAAPSPQVPQSPSESITVTSSNNSSKRMAVSLAASAPVHTPMRPPDRPSDASSSKPKHKYSSPFPRSRNKKLQHKFLGVEWKFIEPPPNEDTYINSSLTQTDATTYDLSKTLYSSKSPRKDNGLLPNDPDIADLILDRIALDMLEDEFAEVEEYNRRDTINKKSRQGSVLSKVLNIFQDGADDRFVRRLKRKEEEAKEKDEELSALELAEDLRKKGERGLVNEKDPANLLLPQKQVKEDKEFKKNLAREERRGSVSMETKVARTKVVAQRIGKALAVGEEGERQKEGTMEDKTKDDGGEVNYGDLDFDVPAYVDRPPSPIVFGRTMTRIRVAENLPNELSGPARLHRSTAERNLSGKDKEKVYDAAAQARLNVMQEVEEAMKKEPNTPEASPKPETPGRRITKISFTASPGQRQRNTTIVKRGTLLLQRGRSPTKVGKSPRMSMMNTAVGARERQQSMKVEEQQTPIHARRSSTAELQKLYFEGVEAGKEPTERNTDESKEGEEKSSYRVEKEKQRYGAWYIKPSKWSVGMGKVMDELAARQQGSWGSEMAIMKEQSDRMQVHIPKLFIGKIFKRELMGKGKRVPHFLGGVEVNEEVDALEGGMNLAEEEKGRRASVQAGVTS